MNESWSAETPEQAGALQLLHAALLSQAGSLFACFDAAPFDTLQADLIGTGLTFKPLWPEDEDAFALAEGPHLVAVPGGDEREQALDDLLEILEEHPEAAVWWVWPGEADDPAALHALERHLRSLAMVEVPVDRFDADEEDREEYNTAVAASQGDPSIPAPSPWEAVFFRHFDANVMASILPLLEIDQFSRLFGEASDILMQAPDFEGLNEAPRPDDMPPKPAGLLRLSHEQYDAVGEKKRQLIQRRMAAYLREFAPSQTTAMSDDQLKDHCNRSMIEAARYGVKSEGSFCRWSYLQIMSNGALNKDTSVHEFMTAPAPGYNADERVKLLMQHTTALVAEQS